MFNIIILSNNYMSFISDYIIMEIFMGLSHVRKKEKNWNFSLTLNIP